MADRTHIATCKLRGRQRKRMSETGAEAYHLEALRRQRLIDRRREFLNGREGKESFANTSRDFERVSYQADSLYNGGMFALNPIPPIISPRFSDSCDHSEHTL